MNLVVAHVERLGTSTLEQVEASGIAQASAVVDPSDLPHTPQSLCVYDLDSGLCSSWYHSGITLEGIKKNVAQIRKGTYGFAIWCTALGELEILDV